MTTIAGIPEGNSFCHREGGISAGDKVAFVEADPLRRVVARVTRELGLPEFRSTLSEADWAAGYRRYEQPDARFYEFERVVEKVVAPASTAAKPSTLPRFAQPGPHNEPRWKTS